MASVDLKTAALVLDRAYQEAELCDDDKGLIIAKIIKGSNKTYRYILVNALLAKATNGDINILSLQKDDGKDGKYDARSLCHKVLVPFEKLKLPGALGNSNEPFLNKPARFVILSTDNAVRNGNDRNMQSDTIELLSQIKDSKSAYKYLRSALAVMKGISNDYIARFSLGDALIDASEFTQLVLDYIYALTDHPCNGETCPLIVAVLEQMYLGKDYKVMAHKVNESGASPKETGDIDVFDRKKNIIYSIEVKDKDFSTHDVAHAVDKFKKAGLDTSLFVYGKKAKFDKQEIQSFLKDTGRNGHYCCLISITSYAKLRICDLKTLTIRDFVDGILKLSKAINVQESTVDAVKDIAKKIFQK